MNGQIHWIGEYVLMQCTWTSKKAFDKVSHKRLISKLSCYGMVGQLGDWVEAFLSDRMQKVCVNNK